MGLSMNLILFLTENRIDFLKKQHSSGIDTSHDTYALHKSADKIIDHFAQHADPTTNKQYTQWILHKYKDKNIRQEDAERVHSALSLFHAHKHRLPEKDINKYSTLSDLEGQVQPFVDAPTTNKEARHRDIEQGLDTLYDDGMYSVHKLKTFEASNALYGGGSRSGKEHGTDWCTAAGREWFDRYTRDPEKDTLHTIHIKGDPDSPYQFHSSGQFMDRADESVNHSHFVKHHPTLAPLLGKMDPEFASTPEEVNHFIVHGNENDLHRLLTYNSNVKNEHFDAIISRVRNSDYGTFPTSKIFGTMVKRPSASSKQLTNIIDASVKHHGIEKTVSNIVHNIHDARKIEPKHIRQMWDYSTRLQDPEQAVYNVFRPLTKGIYDRLDTRSHIRHIMAVMPPDIERDALKTAMEHSGTFGSQDVLQTLASKSSNHGTIKTFLDTSTPAARYHTFKYMNNTATNKNIMGEHLDKLIDVFREHGSPYAWDVEHLSVSPHLEERHVERIVHEQIVPAIKNNNPEITKLNMEKPIENLLPRLSANHIHAIMHAEPTADSRIDRIERLARHASHRDQDSALKPEAVGAIEHHLHTTFSEYPELAEDSVIYGHGHMGHIDENFKEVLRKIVIDKSSHPRARHAAISQLADRKHLTNILHNGNIVDRASALVNQRVFSSEGHEHLENHPDLIPEVLKHNEGVPRVNYAYQLARDPVVKQRMREHLQKMVSSGHPKKDVAAQILRIGDQ